MAKHTKNTGTRFGMDAWMYCGSMQQMSNQLGGRKSRYAKISKLLNRLKRKSTKMAMKALNCSTNKQEKQRLQTIITTKMSIAAQISTTVYTRTIVLLSNQLGRRMSRY